MIEQVRGWPLEPSDDKDDLWPDPFISIWFSDPVVLVDSGLAKD